MLEIVFIAAALFLLPPAVKAFARIKPQQVKQLLRTLGGTAVLVVAAFLMLRGDFAVGVPLGVFGLGLVGWGSLPAALGLPSFKRADRPTRRTAFLAVERDPQSGRLAGRVLSGRYAGTALEALDRSALLDLFATVDRDSRVLLAAYLDRREPGWREYAQGDAAAGGSGRRAASGGKMTEQEAYQVLGIEAGADAQEITRAHRSLMKKLHPDQGGSTYLAARVNEAKDVLFRRHR